MSTRSEILSIADELILLRGYNAFSFADISKRLGIKNASIHYHFSSKSKLGVAVIQSHKDRVRHLILQHQSASPAEQLEAFLSMYEHRKVKNQVCIVGSLATDLNTIDDSLRSELQELVDLILGWLVEILEAGKKAGLFHFKESPRTRALLITTNMLAALQLSRVTQDEDFELIKSTVFLNITE